MATVVLPEPLGLTSSVKFSLTGFHLGSPPSMNYGANMMLCLTAKRD